MSPFLKVVRQCPEQNNHPAVWVVYSTLGRFSFCPNLRPLRHLAEKVKNEIEGTEMRSAERFLDDAPLLP
jgi:hypothetical protein